MKLIPQNEVDAAFMEELKGAISDRNATLDEVIALVRSTFETYRWIGVDGDHLIAEIEALKS